MASLLGKGIAPDDLYAQLGHLVATVPDLGGPGRRVSTPEALLWLGRAHALVLEASGLADAVAFSTASKNLGTNIHDHFQTELLLLLYRALAHAEVGASPAMRGAFIPASSPFDALAAITKILREAKKYLLIVDPYLDETVLTDFAVSVPECVSIGLLGDAAAAKPSLAPAVKRWIDQYGDARPLKVALAPARTLHDRLLLVDESSAWVLTQSLKDFAKRSPASLVRVDEDVRIMKMAAYVEIWERSTLLGECQFVSEKTNK